jgi:hypothetical protein
MAIKWMNYIWEERTDLKGSDLLCAIAIADHADAEGRCHPGIPFLCEKLRLKTRQVQDLIQRLEAKKVLKVVRGIGRGHRSEFQFIKVQYSAPIETAKRCEIPHPLEPEKVQDSAIKGAEVCEEKVQDSANAPYIEPLIEPNTESGRDALLSKTQDALGFGIDLYTQERILDAVPERFEADWISHVKDRMVGNQKSDRNYVATRIGYWISDFKQNIWRLEKEQERKNGITQAGNQQQRSSAGRTIANRWYRQTDSGGEANSDG